MLFRSTLPGARRQPWLSDLQARSSIFDNVLLIVTNSDRPTVDTPYRIYALSEAMLQGEDLAGCQQRCIVVAPTVGTNPILLGESEQSRPPNSTLEYPLTTKRTQLSSHAAIQNESYFI
ncbi:unnamed protein product [Danaus chrysippus]|uniref:(African queen) hypothetical protein n=1 Tax=Danaus chrysippus TaxID=151541 RepID=A0A8J2QEF7_9NEOP|nr:unnamed protein product [Danaus chrysippus]